jgi:AraC-like DNA-binding protein
MSQVTAEAHSARTHFTTDAFGPGEKVAAWHDIYGRTIAKVDLEPPSGGEFMVAATLHHLPGLGLASIASTEMHFRKTQNLIDSNEVLLTIVENGYQNGVQFGRETCIEAGDAVLSTTAEVARGISFGHRTILRIPHNAIAPAVADLGAQFMRRIPKETEGLRLLRRYLHAMQDLDLATTRLQRTTVAHICDLMALMLGATGDAASAAQERSVGAARLCAVKDDIARNLIEGDVSAAAVAARHRVSPRYLRKLFENEGMTFSEYVLDQRLKLAHRLLSDPRRVREKIASVALEAGFGDISYFYRAFRRRYDELPTDVRARAQGVH